MLYLPCHRFLPIASQGRLFLPEVTFFKAGDSGVWRCLAGTLFFFKQKRPFSKQGAPVWGVAWQGRFFSENDPFSFLDIAFCVNGLQVRSLPSK